MSAYIYNINNYSIYMYHYNNLQPWTHNDVQWWMWRKNCIRII